MSETNNPETPPTPPAPTVPASDVNLGPGANRPQPPAPSGINLDSTVTSGGQAFTVKQLLDAQTQLTEMQTRMQTESQQAKELRDSLSTLYSGEAELTTEQAEPHMRRLLTAAGFEGQRLEAQLQMMLPQEDPSAEPTGVGGPGNSSTSTSTPSAGQLDKDTKLQLELLTGHLEADLRRDAKTSVQADPTIKAIIAFRKQSGATPEEVNALVDYLTQEAYAESLRVIQKRYGETGTLKYDWLREAVAPAVGSVAEKARKLTGDPKGLGPSAVDETGEALRILLEDKPKPAPKYSSDDPHGLTPAIEEWGADQIMRAMAGTDGGGGAV